MSLITQPTKHSSAGRVTYSAEVLQTWQSSSVGQKVVRVTLAVLCWIAVALLVAVVGGFVLVSLLWGPTHWTISILLTAAWLGLLTLMLLGATRLHSRRAVSGAVLGFILLGWATLLVSQASAYTPPIVDAEGKAVPGSIASLEKVTLGGHEEWISIRGKNIDNPVLLWLAGGPGGSQLATVRQHLGGLEEQFVVVNWEQPGAGRSYESVEHSTLSVECYISDGHELVQYLRQRFNEEKVYVIGESWGSALGVWLVQHYPDLFHAFVGTGQMVDFIETDIYDYEFALRLAEERGNQQKVAELKRLGPPPYYGDGVLMKQAAYLLDGFAYMNEDPDINSDGWNTFGDILSSEYGLYDKVNWARGVLDSGNAMFPQLWKADVDFRRDAPRLQVPVYFFIGRHDINAPPALTEEYYRLLDAPSKELVWFERSGHNPWVSEPDRFVEIMVNKVLAETQPTK